MLIDTGNQDAMLLAALARSHIYHLDAVLITHADDDHCGSLESLGRHVPIGCVLMSEFAYKSSDEKNQRLAEVATDSAGICEPLSIGDVISVGRFSLTVVWPMEHESDGENADSVVLHADYDFDEDGRSDLKALFTGDAEADQLNMLLDSQVIGDIDILKVGHHGSKNAFEEREIELLSPEVSLISVGKGNR